MIYIQYAITAFSVLALLTLLGGIWLFWQQRYPRKPLFLALAGLCALTALLNLFSFLVWSALPWGLSAAVWAIQAFRRT